MAGKKFVIFKGRKYFYESSRELARKMQTTISQAEKYEKEFKSKKSTRILQNQDNNVLKIDLTKNYLPLLTRTFGIKRLANKKILEDLNIISGKKIDTMAKLGKNTNVQVRIIITVYISFYETNELTAQFMEAIRNNDRSLLKNKDFLENAKIEKRIVTGNGNFGVYNGPVSEIKEYIRDEISRYVSNLAGASVLLSTYRIYDYYGNNRLRWENQMLRENYTYVLSQWDNIRYLQGNKKNCVIEFLLEKFPKIEPEKIEALETKKGVSIESLMRFCDNNEVTYNIYDENGKIRFTKKYEGKSSIAIIAYNNHIYPLNHCKPKKAVYECEFNIVKNCLDIMKRYINEQKIIPYDINVENIFNNLKNQDAKIDVISFKVKVDKKVIKYIQNDEYVECLEILKKYEMEDKIYDNIKKVNLVTILYKKYVPDSILSFFPEQHLFKKTPFQYMNEKYLSSKTIELGMDDSSMLGYDKPTDNSVICTIDKNKSYTYALYTLPYLIVCDWRISKIVANPEKLIDNYLYIAKPTNSTVLMPDENIYSGYFLKYCRTNKIEFKITEEISTTIVMNTFPILIDELRKTLNEKDFKDAFNIFIGKMSQTTTIGQKYECIGVKNMECRDLEPGCELKIDDKHVLRFICDTRTSNTYNMKPIDVQIKDRSRMVLFEKMKSLKIKDDDIIKINTDSISFKRTSKINLTKECGLSSDFDGWKEKTDETFDTKYEGPVERLVPLTFKIENPNAIKTTRQLHMCYAGTGKTYYIINTLIPYIKSVNKTFLVLTPSHKSQDEFHAAGIHEIRVIQTYDYNGKMPDVDVIIIDEIGMVNFKGHELLYRITQTNKDLYAFGDFGQILPPKVNTPICTDHYNKYMYNEIFTMNINRRNNFPIFYYDMVKDETISPDTAVNKYSTKKIEDAEYIACYRKTVLDKYNKIMMKKLGVKYINSPGIKLICSSRKMMDYDIHNGQIFILVRYDKQSKSYILKYTRDDTERSFPSGMLKANFQPAYAINIHKYQGSQLSSYYWCKEDDHFLNGRLAYTIISRLQGNVYNDTEYAKLVELENKGLLVKPYSIRNGLFALDKLENKKIITKSENKDNLEEYGIDDIIKEKPIHANVIKNSSKTRKIKPTEKITKYRYDFYKK